MEEASVLDSPSKQCRAAVPLCCLRLILALVSTGGSLLWAATSPSDQSAEAWPDITPEERSIKRVEQDPDADAVVLVKERSGKILKKADDFVNVLDYHLRYKILTERGKHYGEV